MNLLFRREQHPGFLGYKTVFRLWGKIELDTEEDRMMRRYSLHDSMLIDGSQPNLKRNAIILGAVIAFLLAAWAVLARGGDTAVFLGLIVGGAAGYFYYQEKRETVYVDDLISGRHFKCKSVVELVQKEAWLTGAVHTLRQVMESSKHWDGTETIPIEVLSPEEAKQAIL
jgi:hypothetical protein